MKRMFIIVSLITLSISQTILNTTLKDSKFINDGVDYNDVWGFVKDGKDYIIEGKTKGFIIYEIASNGSATQVLYENSDDNGTATAWGEYRYYKGYIFSSAEGSRKCKIFKIDWNAKTSTYIKTFGNSSMHNITIYNDWILSCHSGGGVDCYDLSSDPENPNFMWHYSGHVHDLAVQDGLMYLAEGSENSSFSVYNISNVSGSTVDDSYKILRFSGSSSGYAHQIWPTPDGKYVVTTIEDNQFDHLGFWDISDPNNVKNLWKHQEGNNSVVHNAFIKDDFIHTSYYDRGYVVFDISDKDLPVKIGEYDTDSDHDNWTTPWTGAWGVYPFLQNNLVVASDIEKGMFVIEFQPTRAGKKTIRIMDASTDALVTNKSISLFLDDTKNVKYKELSAGEYLFKGSPNNASKLTIDVEGYEKTGLPLTFLENESSMLDVKLSKHISYIFQSSESSLKKYITVFLSFDSVPQNLEIKKENQLITPSLVDANTHLYKYTYTGSTNETAVLFEVSYNNQIITVSHTF